ncbi:centrosomal protein kizuna isoform X1 [Camelus ferus]|uniref:Centrosomal protein kizuna n=1 Tax=Camelus ferus TaxID=419612 RepID=A0A8B8RKF1_CAMFR|nr:centrosomal protein kizuna isoform X1 [Camelus ferus]
MRRASAPSAPQASPDYYERLGRLQQGLRDSEKKRLDLERKLYEYNQSDICRVKLKYVKLKKYLKEICESEKRARTRNQEYLKRFEQVQAHAGHFATNAEKLQELKIEYEAQIKKMQLLSKDSLGEKHELKDEDREKVVMLAEINSQTAVSRGVYQPATTFMGRHLSAVSSMGDFSTEQKPPQPTKNFSIPDPRSHRQTAQSRNVTGSCVVQTNSDTRCLSKSDKTDGKTCLQMGEKTPVTAGAWSEEEQTHCLETEGSTRQGRSNLSEGQKSAELHSPSWRRLSPENRASDLKGDSSSRSEGSEGAILTWEHNEVEEDRAGLPVPPASASEYGTSENKCPPERPSAWAASSDHLPCGDPESQKPFRKMQEEEAEESSISSSDLTVSVSEDDLILKSPEPQPNPGDNVEGEDGTEALNLILAGQEGDAPLTGKHHCILQTLSSPDSKKESSANSPTREFERVPASGLPRAGLGQHAATLKGHDSSLQEGAAQLSEVFPVRSMDQRTRAAASLGGALSEEQDGRSTVGSSESSRGSPSTRSDRSGTKDAKPALWLSSVPTRGQDISSICGDESEEESVAAGVPVTETKAYQVLKLSTLQDGARQTEDRLQKAEASVPPLPGLNTGSRTFRTKTARKTASEASFSSSEGSPLSRYENKRKPTTNLKSKAFWGESDDSNSEIEAALRPRNRNTPTDDSDDFYDL